jgi:cob(I)alamin adenosyltransferase
MKIYTKTGDKGTTSLIGGARVLKNDKKIEAYGTLDELNTFIGSIRDYKIDKQTEQTIITIQNKLMNCSSLLAVDDKFDISKLPQISDKDILFLENEIDKINQNLPPVTAFILPGGNSAVSACHISRTVCRRAERNVISIIKNNPVNQLVAKYLNRLSDYLFTLSRKLSKDFNINEIEWRP